MEQMRSVYKILIGKPQGKGPLERARRRLEVNTKMDLKETGWKEWGGVNCIPVAQN
jgi:hypothetical protein